MELSPFEAAGALLPGMVPDDLGVVKQQAHRWGIKVWFDTAKAPREHYEAQVLGAKDVPAAKILAIEVGFHAEHSKEPDNQAVLDRLLAAEKRWRKDVGKEAEAAPFLGRAQHWRRVSETWLDPDLGDPELAFEIAARLTDYITAIEPVRRQS
ncbi:MAG TPA: hypothetical protein VM262_10125 [Acidimicrobiales bacterium]|nr:hypothetical protein [Acidimicrobiales bacterium]